MKTRRTADSIGDSPFTRLMTMVSCDGFHVSGTWTMATGRSRHVREAGGARILSRTTDDKCERHPEAPEVFLPFDKKHLRASPLRKLTICLRRTCRIKVCRGWNSLGEPGLGGAIVLLGGDYADMNDWHRTPIGERTTGLFINASAGIA